MEVRAGPTIIVPGQPRMVKMGIVRVVAGIIISLLSSRLKGGFIKRKLERLFPGSVGPFLRGNHQIMSYEPCGYMLERG